MGALRGFRGEIHILHDEKIELFNYLVECRLIDPGVRRVRRNYPEAFDLVIRDPFDDLVVSQTILIGNSVYVDAENPRDLCPIFCIQKIMAAKHICRIRKKPGAHRVTLAGDRVGARPGPPDIAGHQREIDDRLRRARGLVALIHTHCPPERDTPPPMDRLCKFSQLLCIQSGRLAHRICGELRDKVCECLKA
jgi:hypothetical protein